MIPPTPPEPVIPKIYYDSVETLGSSQQVTYYTNIGLDSIVGTMTSALSSSGSSSVTKNCNLYVISGAYYLGHIFVSSDTNFRLALIESANIGSSVGTWMCNKNTGSLSSGGWYLYEVTPSELWTVLKSNDFELVSR